MRSNRPSDRRPGWVLSPALLLALTLLLAPTVAPVVPAEAGTATNAMAFLDLGAGARAAGLSGAVSAQVQDATAVYWNPAGLARIDGWDLAGTHTEWLQDIRYEQVSLARHRGRLGIGFGFATAYAGDFDGRDEVGNQTLTFGFSDVSLSGTVAYALAERIQVGGTVKYYRESIDDFSADGLAFDLGAQYQTGLDGLSFGAALRNLGGKVQFDVASAGEFDLPRTIQVGGAYSLPLGGQDGSLNLSADLVSETNFDASLRFGAEYMFRRQFGLALGYRSDTGGPESSSTGQTLDATQNVSFGASYHRAFRFEYAFVPFTSDLGTTHRFSIGKSW